MSCCCVRNGGVVRSLGLFDCRCGHLSSGKSFCSWQVPKLYWEAWVACQLSLVQRRVSLNAEAVSNGRRATDPRPTERAAALQFRPPDASPHRLPRLPQARQGGRYKQHATDFSRSQRTRLIAPRRPDRPLPRPASPRLARRTVSCSGIRSSEALQTPLQNPPLPRGHRVERARGGRHQIVVHVDDPRHQVRPGVAGVVPRN